MVTATVGAAAVRSQPTPKRRARAGAHGVRADPHYAGGFRPTGSELTWLAKEIDAARGPGTPSGLLAQALALPGHALERGEQLVEAIQVALDVARVQRAIPFRY